MHDQKFRPLNSAIKTQNATSILSPTRSNGHRTLANVPSPIPLICTFTHLVSAPTMLNTNPSADEPGTLWSRLDDVIVVKGKYKGGRGYVTKVHPEMITLRLIGRADTVRLMQGSVRHAPPPRPKQTRSTGVRRVGVLPALDALILALQASDSKDGKLDRSQWLAVVQKVEAVLFD